MVPQLLSGEESEECVVETLISGVDQATTYVVKVVGQTVGGLMGEVADVSAIATTFGAGEFKVQSSELQLLVYLYRNSGNFHCHVIFVMSKKKLKLETSKCIRFQYKKLKLKTMKITNTKKNLD